jgi:hypothetical protein
VNQSPEAAQIIAIQPFYDNIISFTIYFFYSLILSKRVSTLPALRIPQKGRKDERMAERQKQEAAAGLCVLSSPFFIHKRKTIPATNTLTYLFEWSSRK